MKVSLFIPVYNASVYISHALNEAYRSLSECCSEFEIVIVDDNSNDESVTFLQSLEKEVYPHEKMVRVIRNARGPSRRENLAKAFATAKYDLVTFIDVDLSCGMSYLVKALECIMMSLEHAIVIGSRYIRGAKVVREPFRQIISFLYNRAIQILFGSKIRDHQCGLKVFRMSRVRDILDKMDYDHDYHRGWFWDAEFLIRAQKNKLKITEMPVEWRYARTSTFRLFREWKCIGTMLGLKAELSPKFKVFLGLAKIDLSSKIAAPAGKLR